MSAGRIIGGIIVLVGALFILIQTFINIDQFGYAPWLINLAFGLGAVIGGVFGMKGQKGAVFMVIIIAVLSIILGIVSVALPDYRFWQYSFIEETLVDGLRLQGISIEAFLIAMGGIEISFFSGD